MVTLYSSCLVVECPQEVLVSQRPLLPKTPYLTYDEFEVSINIDDHKYHTNDVCPKKGIYRGKVGPLFQHLAQGTRSVVPGFGDTHQWLTTRVVRRVIDTTSQGYNVYSFHFVSLIHCTDYSVPLSLNFGS